MGTDQHGNAVSGAAPGALAAYDAGVDHLLHFRSAVGDSVERAQTADPGFALGQVFAAYLGVLGTEPADAAEARAGLDAFEAGLDPARLNDRERRHVAAAHALVRGQLVEGGRILRDLTAAHPRDALALAVGHQVDFFTADGVSLRDRVGGALSAWNTDDPHYAELLGMYAFGLEETGLYARAEEVGLEAVERDPADVWGIHAVTHTYEMQGRFHDGTRYLDAHASDWQQGNFLTVHTWWHACLYALEAGDSQRPLEVYDAVLHNAESAGLAMEMLDASALLWRLYLEGSDQTERWSALASSWDPYVAAGPHYVFNDVHAVMAYVGCGRIADAERLVEGRARWVAEAVDASVTNLAMTREVGLPVARALVAFGRADYARTVELLAPIRTVVQRFGGSHAQRDAVQRTLLEAALRSGSLDLARLLVSERLGVNPCSPYSWLKRAALLEAVGDATAVEIARARVTSLRAGERRPAGQH